MLWSKMENKNYFIEKNKSHKSILKKKTDNYIFYIFRNPKKLGLLEVKMVLPIMACIMLWDISF
jgi:hypothetical protein